MPGIQEFIALGIVALVAGRMVWRRWATQRGATRTGAQSGACGNCAAAGPPPKEATVHFFRRREKEEGPASGALR